MTATSRSAPGQTPAKSPILLFQGVPDSQRAHLRWVAWDKPPGLISDGTASFLTQLRDLPVSLRGILFGGAGMRMDARLPRVPCLNFMADADVYGSALAQATEFVKAMGTPCFNHPSAVLATTRDGVARALDGVAGLAVPRTVKVKVDTLAQLKAAMDEAGIRFPVIVRLAGDHGGVSTALVKDDSQWEALNPLGWGGRPIYLTQYVDYADADGRYRKLRLVVVGGQVLLRHQIVSDQWLVHAKSRAAGFADEERRVVESFEQAMLPRVGPVVRDIAGRLRLDYFGIDASLRPDGSLLLFEANATMNSLRLPTGHPDWAPVVVGRISVTLAQLLAQPTSWHHRPAGGGPPAV
ncbi:MAG: hypothetical protein IPK34_10950 [Ramlibacter sp.]|nr:hypothetical protein [Ramlibacter sp.]